MSKIVAFLLTAILASCSLVPFVLRNGRTGFAVTAFIAIGILWAVVLWKGMPVGLKVPLIIALVVLVIVSIMGSLVGVGTGLADRWDQPRNEAPVIMGNASSSDSIAIVYHPGGSGFAKKVVMSLGGILTSKGYSVSIYTANLELSLNQGKYKALVFCSPVYGGQIRPPLQKFISDNSPLSIPVFAVLTGGFAGFEENDLRQLTEIVARAGGSLRTGVKILRRTSSQAIEEKIGSFCDTIERTLENR
jgi:hypothetical protein